ncbi:nucleotidyltransferase domain-containing protein [Thermosediminibacter oceani]|uniref:DNA polymerase beta domain protein region n=1 Tax=Thermosediminibacter oceani (strain ATCC BAA-1034 / DSM 16646 / JW/IW-1228P) TaxID=555079 RepID=D9S0N2_THEOJ|nr:nucleotidyltransferase domain-containing protein [Thermosediminibacter oceani]ADL08890.1 DNA polymerase beta domain protein region [Thermosediminibacter oceani DSM 16646]
MIPQEKIDRAVEILKKEASPAKIILFGSYARGDMNEDSDIDFLVIKENVEDRRKEMVRLRRLLSPLRIPVDIIVVSSKYVEEWGNVKGSVLYPALREGKVLHEAK